jgi:ComF family protein
MPTESSAIVRRLSIWRSAFLNNCAQTVQRVGAQQCLLCTAPAAAQPLCAACYTNLPWLPDSLCPQCATPTTGGKLCGACLSRPPHFDRTNAAFTYAWPLTPLIHQFKYAGNLALAGVLGTAIAKRVVSGADLIIPMPLAPARLRERGFNQALEIARVVSRLTGAPLALNACRRVRDSAPQAMLPWGERAKNIRGAFVCDADIRGRRVAVLDDVMTTGATLNEIARTLRRAGASEVEGWVAARTLKSGIYKGA